MLLSKEIDVMLSPKTTNHYEQIGYLIPREKDKRGRVTVPRGTMIKVKVGDLLKGSMERVMVKCDECCKIISVVYSAYNKCVHDDGKYYCNNCNNKVLNSGINNHNWNNNLTEDERTEKRNKLEYKDWIKKIFDRDKYTCMYCSKKGNGKNLNAHHLNGYNWCVNQRYDVNNGVTLCEKCHKNFHSLYGYGDNTREQFDEWYGRALATVDCDKNIYTCRRIYCFEENNVYNSAEEIAKNWGLKSVSHIYDVCNNKVITGYYNGAEYKSECKTIKKKHLLWFDEYEKMTKDELEKFIKSKDNLNRKSTKKSTKKVICTTTGVVFDSMKEASEYYDCNYSLIGECCKGRVRYCGKLKDGSELKWSYT